MCTTSLFSPLFHWLEPSCMILNRSGEREYLCLVPNLKMKAFSLFSYYVTRSLRVFIMSGHWVRLNFLAIFIEMNICFIFGLLIRWITLIYFHVESTLHSLCISLGRHILSFSYIRELDLRTFEYFFWVFLSTFLLSTFFCICVHEGCFFIFIYIFCIRIVLAS